MRILLVNQGPLHGAESGLSFAGLSVAFRAAGHEVRRLAVDCQDQADEAVPVLRIASRPGDPAPILPREPPRAGSRTSASLSDRQLADYRDVLRQALDAEIDAFDPHIVHVYPIGILAHLALEAGTPYVLTATGVELPVDRLDPRLRRLTEEAAENAGRIIALSDAVRAAMIAAFGDLDDRVVTMPRELAAMADTHAETARWLTEIYRQVLIDRFGTCPES